MLRKLRMMAIAVASALLAGLTVRGVRSNSCPVNGLTETYSQSVDASELGSGS